MPVRKNNHDSGKQQENRTFDIALVGHVGIKDGNNHAAHEVVNTATNPGNHEGTTWQINMLAVTQNRNTA